jgi:ubiquitin-conjugating enzyme E2 variant
VSARGKAWEPATPADVVAAGVFCVLLAPFAYGAAAALVSGDGVPWIVAAILLGLLGADLVTGTVHWACDTFFTEQTPVIGRHVIESFREHHRDQLAMTRRAFLRLSNSNVVGTSVVLAILCWRRVASDETPSAFADAWITSLAGALMLTNQLHKWAHQPRVPALVARLQAWGLILSPAEHARHHTGDHARAYCVTTGWLNPLLDGLGVFATCERLVSRLRRGVREA